MTQFTSRRLKVITPNSIGVPTGIYDTVECPEEHKEKFANDAWVMHPTRNEPVRLFTEGHNKEAIYLSSKEDILMGMKAAGATPQMIDEELIENGYEKIYATQE